MTRINNRSLTTIITTTDKSGDIIETCGDTVFKIIIILIGFSEILLKQKKNALLAYSYVFPNNALIDYQLSR